MYNNNCIIINNNSHLVGSNNNFYNQHKSGVYLLYGIPTTYYSGPPEYAQLLVELYKLGVPFEDCTKTIKNSFTDLPVIIVNGKPKKLGINEVRVSYPDYLPVIFVNRFQAWINKYYFDYHTRLIQPQERKSKIIASFIDMQIRKIDEERLKVN